MRKLLLGVVVTLLLSAGPAKAQYDPARWFSAACPTCRVEANVDWVQVIPELGTVIAGWGFECSTGRPVNRVDVWYEDAQGIAHPVQAWIGFAGIYRPDVTLYSGWVGCGPAHNSGFGVIVDTPPDGYVAVIVNMWRGPHKQQQRIAIAPASAKS